MKRASCPHSRGDSLAGPNLCEKVRRPRRGARTRVGGFCCRCVSESGPWLVAASRRRPCRRTRRTERARSGVRRLGEGPRRRSCAHATASATRRSCARARGEIFLRRDRPAWYAIQGRGVRPKGELYADSRRRGGRRQRVGVACGTGSAAAARAVGRRCARARPPRRRSGKAERCAFRGSPPAPVLWRVRMRRLIVAALLAALATGGGAAAANALPGGIASTVFGATGCPLCHGGGVAPDVLLSGPTSVAPGDTAEYTLTIFSNTAQNYGGFNVAVPLGTVSTGGPFALGTQTIPGALGLAEITHTAPKQGDFMNVIEFSFQWTAPPAYVSTTMRGWGNAVNLDSTTGGDAASLATLDVFSTTLDTPTARPTPTRTPGVPLCGNAAPLDPPLVTDHAALAC